MYIIFCHKMKKIIRFLMASILLFTCINYLNLPTPQLFHKQRLWWAEKTRLDQGCTFPRQPFSFPKMDEELDQMPAKFDCLGSIEGYELLFDIDYENSTLFGVNAHNSTRWKDCCYKLALSADTLIPIICFPLSNGTTVIPVEAEFLYVFCHDLAGKERGRKMVQAFALTPIMKEAEDKMINSNRRSKVNVVIYGWDSVSRMNILRTTPTLHEYLLRNLSAVWFEGYNRVGEGSLDNLMPLFTGQTKDETEADCASSLYFDTCPFIWKEFADAGYRTVYGEDARSISIFFFNFDGFQTPPTDYFLMPFVAQVEHHISHVEHCHGPQLSNQLLLNYIKSAAWSIGKAGMPYFQFVHSTALTHTSITPWNTAFGEKPFLQLLQWMQGKGLLNDTVFVFMSDHGHRSFTDSPEGKTEANLPYIYFVFPPWFYQKYPRAMQNLQQNRQRLTTHYDTRQTLLDLKDLDRIADDVIEQREQGPSSGSRGISLFLPIPLNRTCKTAHIPLQFCSCEETEGEPLEVNNSSDHAILEGAGFIVTQLNEMIKDQKNCREWSLEKVLWAKLRPNGDNDDGSLLYEVGIMTAPGNATFDAIVSHKTDEPWSLSEPIIRRSRYGSQSHCVGRKLKPFCFCKDYHDSSNEQP